ncbi:hypothetical protein DPV78_004027 [Talaromyces pinophilus]|nr:hypothetical protein DPV78_004027 [Talaromyces pinophilus]
MHRVAHSHSRDILAAALESNATLGEQPKGLCLDGMELSDIAGEAMVWKDAMRYAELKEGNDTRRLGVNFLLDSLIYTSLERMECPKQATYCMLMCMSTG